MNSWSKDVLITIDKIGSGSVLEKYTEQTGRRIKVLIVDDEPIILDIIQEFFEISQEEL